MPILYEPTSTRGDHGIWKMTYGQPSRTPFKFDWKGKTSGGEFINFKIDSSCYVQCVIKENISDEIYVILKNVQVSENNTIMFELDRKDVSKLLGGKEYHLTMTLFDENNELIRILLSDLPIRIEGSGVSDEY